MNKPARVKCSSRPLASSLCAAISPAVFSQPTPTDTVIDEVIVFGDLRGLPTTALTATEGVVTEENIRSRPVSRVAELLEFVPGLIATQHSGEGKANQYFLRGFNLDHGTDFAVDIDGLPVNMPTHAHGQGYTDLNFLIPELIGELSYRKGPYYADVGDFSAAGSADFEYVDTLAHGVVNATAGSEDYYRVFGADSYQVKEGELLLASALTRYHGPWELEQDLKKLNGLVKYQKHNDRSSWSVTGMAYDNSWKATDQIPVRAVESGLINAFGYIDPSDGGETHRYSLSWDWEGQARGGTLKIGVYALDYALDLFSNFSYFLANPELGDQFEQLDDRKVYGVNAAYRANAKLFGVDSEWSIGAQTRYDDIHVGLYQTNERRRFATIREDDVRQGSVAMYVSLEQKWHEKLRSVVSARLDRYRFDVDADLPINSGSETDALLSPKASLILGPWSRTQFYFSVGRGFHSNDARGVTTRMDPSIGESTTPADPLSKARSIEFGVRSDALSNAQLAVSVFSLKLDSELVFVGDAGATESLNGSDRLGVEIAAVYSPVDWITLDADFALTHARLNTNSGEDYIPQSVERAASCGIVMDGPSKWSGGVRLRYLGPAPLIETNEVRSSSTFTVNAEAAYALTSSWSLKLGLYNALNSKDNDITYFYDSRLPGEDAAGVADRHFHPVEPRALRFTIAYQFL